MPGWQFTPLPNEALASLPQASRRYLSETGLPTGIELWMANIRNLIFTPYSPQEVHLCGVDYLQIGYSGFTPVFRNLPPNPLAIECASGEVYLLNSLEIAADHEGKLPRWFFNSSIEKLVQSLTTYEKNLPRIEAHNHYVTEREKRLTGLHDAPLARAIKELRQHGQRTYGEIRPQIEAIDPPAFDSRDKQSRLWPDTLLEIRWSSSTPSAD